MSFTPGPWEFDGVCQIVESARPHMRVAFLPSDHAEYASSKANGHLIAAAPQLLEALENADSFFEGSENDGCMAHRMIIDAIAAAKDNAS